MHDAVYWIAASPVIYTWMRGNLWSALIVFAAMLVCMGLPALPPYRGWQTTPAEDAVSDIAFYVMFALTPTAVLWVRDQLQRFEMERDARSLPPLGVTLPGLEQAVDFHPYRATEAQLAAFEANLVARKAASPGSPVTILAWAEEE